MQGDSGLTDGPFMPRAEITAETKIETTWGVLQGYQRQLHERDVKIADLIMERDALIAKLTSR